jgi:hypothetical protein
MDKVRPQKHSIAASAAATLVLLCLFLMPQVSIQAESEGSSFSPESSRALLAPGISKFSAEADDPADLLVTPTEVSLAEAGPSATYEAVLSKVPSAPVVVTIDPDDQTQVNLGLVIFDENDWNTPKTITVYAIDDAVAEAMHSSNIRHDISSLDPRYGSLPPVYVKATIEDNDTAGIRVSPSELAVAEPDGTAVFTVNLTSEPMSDVKLPLSPSNKECAVSPAQIVLDNGNWSAGESATVSATDDNLVDGEQICLIPVGPASTNDPLYRELSAGEVRVSVGDNDKYRLLLPLARRLWPPPPGTPVLDTIENPDGDGAFTVKWSASERAETYVLEQASSGQFQDRSQIFEGPATSHDVTGLGASRRFYRVKARNSSGDSGWSNVRPVDIVWHLEGRSTEDREEEERQTNGSLISGLMYRGRILNDTDVSDYFYFDLPAGRTVEIWLSNIPTGSNFDLALRDRNLSTQEGWYSVRSEFRLPCQQAGTMSRSTMLADREATNHTSSRSNTDPG